MTCVGLPTALIASPSIHTTPLSLILPSLLLVNRTWRHQRANSRTSTVPLLPRPQLVSSGGVGRLGRVVSPRVINHRAALCSTLMRRVASPVTRDDAVSDDAKSHIDRLAEEEEHGGELAEEQRNQKVVVLTFARNRWRRFRVFASAATAALRLYRKRDEAPPGRGLGPDVRSRPNPRRAGGNSSPSPRENEECAHHWSQRGGADARPPPQQRKWRLASLTSPSVDTPDRCIVDESRDGRVDLAMYADGVETTDSRSTDEKSSASAASIGKRSSVDLAPHPATEPADFRAKERRRATAAASIDGMKDGRDRRGDGELKGGPDSCCAELSPVTESFERGRWLLGLLVLQSTSSSVLDRYQELLREHFAVTLFLTMLVGAGGNAGNQSAIKVIRVLAMGQYTADMACALRIIGGQALVGLLLGTALSAGGFARVMVTGGTTVRDATAIATSLFFIVMTSVLLGSALPFGFARAGVDPANAGTSIQVAMDIAGVAITCVTCSLVFEQLGQALSVAPP